MKEAPFHARIIGKDEGRFMSNPGDDLIPTRQSLLNRLKDLDDASSWKEFFNSYWRLIYGVARKAGLTEVEAEEVVQETVISVSRKMPDFNYDPSIGSFKGWLMHMTHWRIKDQLRKRQRNAVCTNPGSETSLSMEHIADPEGCPLDKLWDEEWSKHMIEVALARVKTKVQPKHYQIFDLCVIKRWPLRKVADSLNVNIGQVYLVRHRIGAMVKKEIKALESKLI